VGTSDKLQAEETILDVTSQAEKTVENLPAGEHIFGTVKEQTKEDLSADQPDKQKAPLADQARQRTTTAAWEIKRYAAAHPENAYHRAGYAGELKKQGSNLVGLCHFHPDTNPSFKISLTGDAAGCFKCFGCDAAGSVIDFVKRAEKISTDREAVERTAELLGITEAAPAPPRRKPVPEQPATLAPLSQSQAKS